LLEATRRIRKLTTDTELTGLGRAIPNLTAHNSGLVDRNSDQHSILLMKRTYLKGSLPAERIFMKTHQFLAATIAAILVLAGGATVAQDRGQRGGQNQQVHTQFDEHDQQVTRDWYNQNQAHPPAGLRNQDRLSADEESRLHEGAVLDKVLRRKLHPAPPDLARRLPPPPREHRYVAIGGHVGLIDNNFQVKAVIHLQDNH
jgi:Ni/Co efflux regulator RcnB